jgi:hypothetical protein
MTRFGPALVAIAAAVAASAIVGASACGHAPAEPATMSNRAPGVATGTVPSGDYACRIDEGGYRYPPFHCIISARGGRTFLEKVEGSVRFRGTITARGDGFAFDGELYCPWGDCTEKVHSNFAADGPGAYHGTVDSLQSGPATVTLSYVPGGYAAGLGGDGYGGGGYGYGGAASPGVIDSDP